MRGPEAHRTVLVVDDEEAALLGIELALRSGGFPEVATCSDPRQAADLLRRDDIAVLLVDLNMPHIGGEEILARCQALRPDVPVLVITARNEVDTAVRLVQAGAFDYVVKPFGADRLLPAVARAAEVGRLRRENADLRARMLSAGLAHPEAFAGMATANQGMRALFAYVECVAPSSQPVLISGETGTGKELMARTVHQLSGRTGQFTAANVAGLDDQLFSDALFGHVRGAFTGAERDRAGLVARAEGGTLFLDEVADLPVPSQVKLLRFLQEREYEPLGADTPRPCDVRVVAAANRDLWAEVCRGRFRADLFHRLACHRVDVPPLRQRRDDVPLLLERFVAEAAAERGLRPPAVAKEVLQLLGAYHFPGNVRELRALAFDAVAAHKGGALAPAAFRAHITRTGWAADPAAPAAFPFPDRLPPLRELEGLAVAEALRRSGGNQSVAALMLGISQQALSKRLAREDEAPAAET